jgi:hypothetical protein
MRYSLLLLPLALLGLAGCVVSEPARPVTTTSTTYSSPPPAMYVAPGETTTTTTVRRPY